ncbi:MAG: M24 family metallopeptidase, partial [Anaerolineae bacterium]|nr:M24 family metallopeptidase [Anaerolineae bacterium]
MPSQLQQIDLPVFSLPSVEPFIDVQTYQARLERFYQLGDAGAYDYLLVYGDREHSANLAYLTGYDPRFEEALLICNIRAGLVQKPLLLVGNEGYGYSKISPIHDQLEIIRYQSFSLLGQDRTRSKPIHSLFDEAGITSGKKVGVIGWKYFNNVESNHPSTWLEIPAYLVDTLREMTGSREYVTNATSLLMDSSAGLRSINEVDQLARFEFVSSYASQAVRNVLFGVKPGMTEFEAVQLMQLNGLPLSCHVMLSAGERAFLGMGSPTSRVIRHGEPFTNAVGLWGSLTSRAGFMVASAGELPSSIRDYVQKLVAPYFEAVAAWYEHIGIGVTGGELYRIIHDRIGDPFYGVHLNPGHLIHLDEWLNSPIYDGSSETLQSGMAIQVDVIPATGTPYYTTNIEDGILLADEALRREFATVYPEAWGRIQARRDFMQNKLGITLKP